MAVAGATTGHGRAPGSQRTGWRERRWTSRWRGFVLLGVAAALVMGSGGGDVASPLLAARENANTAFDLFDAQAENHDWINSYLLGLLSEHAYLVSHDHRYDNADPTTEGNFPDRFRDYADLAGLDGDSVQYLSVTDPGNVLDTQAILVENDDALFVVFRGSEVPNIDLEAGELDDLENLFDWLTNAQAMPSDDADLCLALNDPVLPGVHCGFHRAAQAVYADVLARVQDVANPADPDPLKVWVTGHSLGGALAAVTTWMLEQDGFSVQGMTTFAAPRSFLDETSAAFSTALGSRAWRWVNNEDPVPHVPPPTLEWLGIEGLEYLHAGGLVNIHPDAGGACQVTVDDVENLVPGLRISEHSMRLYLARIHDAIPPEVTANLGVALPAPSIDPDDGAASTLTPEEEAVRGTCPTGPIRRGSLSVRFTSTLTDADLATIDDPILDFREVGEDSEATSDWLGALLAIGGLDGDGSIVVRLDHPAGLDQTVVATPLLDLGRRLVGFEATLPDLAGDKSATLRIEAEWPPDRDPAIPTIRLGLSSEATWSIAEVASVLGLDLDGLATTTLFDGFAAALQWDPDGETWFDLTSSLKVGGLPFAALVSGNPAGGSTGQSLYALCSGEVSLGSLLGPEVGAFAGDLILPSATLPMVLPEGTSMTVGDLRDGIPADFFAGPCALRTGSGTGGDEGGDDGGDRELLPDNFEITDTLSLAANLPVGQVAELRDVLGLEEADVVALTGRLGFTLTGFQDASFGLNEVSLKADLPAVSVQGLPFWLTGVGAGPSTIGLDWTAADGDTPGSLDLFARTAMQAAFDHDLSVDTPDVEITFDPVELRYQDDGQSLRVKVLAASGSDLLAPLGLSWLEMTGIGLAGEVGISDDDGPFFDVELSSAVAFHVQNTDECPSGAEPTATVFLGLALSEGAVTGRARVAMTDVPLGWMACTVATQYDGVDASAFGEFADFALSELTLAAEVASSGEVRFEAGMASTEFELLGLTLPAVRGYVLAEIDGDLTLVIGIRPEEDISLTSLLGAEPDEDSALSSLVLPTSGIVASYGEYSVGKGALTEDGRAFFGSLHGDADDYTVQLVSGINLLSNIPLPDDRAFEELRDNLWLDPTGGIQFRGGLGIPFGPEIEPKLSLELELPRISPPDELEWLTGGSMYLRLEVDTTPKLVVSLGGTMNTRWRRPDGPVQGTCTLGEVGVFEGVQYCYDHLDVEGSAAISLSASGISFTLEAALVSGDELGWRQPFGVEWLTIYEVRLLFGVTVPPSGSVNFTLGFRGAVAIGDGEPTNDVVIDLSAAFDIQVQSITAPPGFVLIPKPVGFRGYISTLPITDLARMGAAAFPANLGELSEQVEIAFEELPHVEIRNAELMFGLQDFPSLCISTGFLLAGELWISADAFVSDPNADPPTPPDCGGSPITPDSTVSLCSEESRSRGCFAAGVIDVSLDGIVGKLSIGGIDLDPLVFDDTELELILTPTQQSFVFSGGASLDPLGAATLAVALRSQTSPSPAAMAEFYGMVQFGPGSDPAFRAVVDGSAELATQAVPIGLDGDLSMFASLETDFAMLGDWGDDNRVRMAQLADDVAEVKARYEYLVSKYQDDPLAVLKDAKAFLQGSGVAVPAWVDQLIAHIELVHAEFSDRELALPDLGDILAGASLGTVEIPSFLPGNMQCPPGATWGWSWRLLRDTCIGDDGSTTDPDCLGINVVVLGETVMRFRDGEYTGWKLLTLNHWCKYSLSLAEAPASITNIVSTIDGLRDAIANLYVEVVDGAIQAALHTADLIVSTTLDGIEDTFRRLATDEPGFSLECAQFGFVAGQDESLVSMTLAATVNGQRVGFRHDVDLNDPPLDQIWGLFFGAFWDEQASTVECREPAAPPDGVSAILPLSLQVNASPSILREGRTVTLSGTLSRPAEESTDIRITWGDLDADGKPAVTTVTVPSGEDTFKAIHRYVDDAPPKGVPHAVLPITATVVESPLVTASTSVRVRNVAPSIEILRVPDVDEGSEGVLRFRVTDPGIRDTHTAVIDWGDGVVSEPFSVTAGEVVERTHLYLDDKPKFTPSDPVTVTVTVTDDDTGVGTATGTGTIRNVPPVIPADVLQSLEQTVVKEGDEVTFTIEFEDPGVLDTHLVWVDWGDETSPDLRVVAPSPGRGSEDRIRVEFTHTYVDDAVPGTASDPYTMTIVVLDDDLGATSETVEVTVRNVVPYDLNLVVDPDEIDELGTVTLSGTFTDPGILDWFCVDVDWGHDVLQRTMLRLPAGVRSFDASRQYGDHGDYTITVTLWDKDRPVADGADPQDACSERADLDLDHAAVETIDVIVNNVDPDVVIDDSDAIDPPSGIRTLLLRAGEVLTMTATATDPGSDDLTFSWDWDDGTVENVGTSWWDPDEIPDVFPSPHVSPRTGDDAATMSASHAWEEACLYPVTVTVVDDDGGAGNDTIPVAVTGTDHRVRSPGWWYTEMSKPGRNSQSLSVDELTCRLAIAGHLSSVFDDLRDATTLDLAAGVLNTSRTSSAAENMERQLLAVWLNLANGSLGWTQLVDTTGDRTLDMTVGDLLHEAEAVRHNPLAADQQLLEQAARLERANKS